MIPLLQVAMIIVLFIIGIFDGVPVGLMLFICTLFLWAFRITTTRAELFKGVTEGSVLIFVPLFMLSLMFQETRTLDRIVGSFVGMPESTLGGKQGQSWHKLRTTIYHIWCVLHPQHSSALGGRAVQ